MYSQWWPFKAAKKRSTRRVNVNGHCAGILSGSGRIISSTDSLSVMVCWLLILQIFSSYKWTHSQHRQPEQLILITCWHRSINIPDEFWESNRPKPQLPAFLAISPFAEWCAVRLIKPNLRERQTPVEADGFLVLIFFASSHFVLCVHVWKLLQLKYLPINYEKNVCA